MEKGFQGELQFDSLTENLQNDCLILNDLQLRANNTEFQMDTLIIFQKMLYIIEVKNYEGEYSYDPEMFQMAFGKEVLNPLAQLNRSKSLLRLLLQSLNINFSIEGKIVFVNPQFTLYKASPDLPFIYPTQLKSFLTKLDTIPSHLNSSHKKLAEKLTSMHLTGLSPNAKLPAYEITQLRKGITCKKCYSFSISTVGRKVVCSECGCEELVTTAILRSIEELKLLFPHRKITTREVHDWCQVIDSKLRIGRLLRKHFKMKGIHQWAFYE
ncbi:MULTISPECIES: nuclease-related domain-containing protein [unclassified Bacillus (in: firmicutes)]|uniref:nuclease-related domain-containing protein n=1 Tax=unclassified Bacillus (in: firmicutes) TaxID=185979 RepID=UPI0020C91B72|nr:MULTISPECIES: nuclease-related domain-containing protein [unclassified Bacillus (in: firmicutes)]